MTKYIQDPGHGGTDPGAVHSGNVEKVYTLEAGLYVDKRLADHGIASSMTRTTDKTLDPGPRTNIVKGSGAGRCFSHHYNAGGGYGSEFIHSIYSDGRLENMMAEEFEKAGLHVRKVYTRKNSSGKDYYYMHRDTGAVSTTIIEYDFVDGKNKDKIKSKEYRESMYEAVVRAVCRFEGVPYKPITKYEKKPDAPKMEAKGESELSLAQWQLDEMARVYELANKQGIFSSNKHAEQVKKGEMTKDDAIYLVTALIGAQMNNGKRV